MSVIELSCQCGAVALEVTGKHIVSAECYCNSCRKAGAHLESLPGAPVVLEANGATRFVLQRKDRIRCMRGAEHLGEYRLSPEAGTRRVVASCCNTPMFLEFLRGHWLSLYGHRYPADHLPPLEVRTMTSDVDGLVLPDDVPNGRTQPASFMFKLLGAWISMGFRVPPITYVSGTLEAPSARAD